MVSFKDAAANAIRGGLCAVIAINDDVQRLFGRVIGNSAADYFNVAGALRSQICNADPDDTTPFPTLTGQCPVQYEFRYSISGFEETPQTNSSVIGPMSAPVLVPGFSAFYQAFNGFGELLNFGNASTQLPSNFIEWRRVDGQPDDCGGLVPQPVEPVSRPITVIYDIDGGPEITLNGNVVFAPVFADFNGELNIPFTLDLGGFNWSGDIKVNPDVDVNLFPDGIINIGGATDGTNEPFPDDPSDPIDPVDENSPPTIIGVEVFSQVSPGASPSSIFFPGAPNIYAPRLGSVKFAIRTPTSLVWTEDLSIKNRETYIPCPAPQGAVAVRVSPLPGVTCIFNAIRSRPLLEVS